MKKFNCVILLSLLISVMYFNVAFATNGNGKMDLLREKGYIEGNENGNLFLDKSITRAQATKLIVLANNDGAQAEKLKNKKGKYIDVDVDYWANGFINTASTKPVACNGQFIVHGYPCGKYLPDRKLSCAEFAKMLVILTDENMTEDKIKSTDKLWPGSWIEKAKKDKIFDGINIPYENDEINRETAFVMFYNALHNAGLI